MSGAVLVMVAGGLVTVLQPFPSVDGCEAARLATTPVEQTLPSDDVGPEPAFDAPAEARRAWLMAKLQANQRVLDVMRANAAIAAAPKLLCWEIR